MNRVSPDRVQACTQEELVVHTAVVGTGVVLASTEEEVSAAGVVSTAVAPSGGGYTLK